MVYPPSTVRKLTRRGGYQQARPQTPEREDTVTQLQINYHSHTRSQEDAVSPTLPLPTCAHSCPPPCPSPPVHTCVPHPAPPHLCTLVSPTLPLPTCAHLVYRRWSDFGTTRFLSTQFSTSSSSRIYSHASREDLLGCV